MKSMIWVGLMMVLLTACTSKFDGFDPVTSSLRWVLTNGKKNFDVKRTSVHIMPSAIPCTATVDPRYKMRLGVEPLPSCKYVHGKHGG